MDCDSTKSRSSLYEREPYWPFAGLIAQMSVVIIWELSSRWTPGTDAHPASKGLIGRGGANLAQKSRVVNRDGATRPDSRHMAFVTSQSWTPVVTPAWWS